MNKTQTPATESFQSGHRKASAIQSQRPDISQIKPVCQTPGEALERTETEVPCSRAGHSRYKP